MSAVGKGRGGSPGLGAVGPGAGRSVPEMCSPTQPGPFHTDSVFSSNQTICPRLKPLLIPPQCQALVSVSALERPSSSPLLLI